MTTVLLATDADWIHEDVDAAIAGDDIEVLRVREGIEVRPAVQTGEFDLVVLDQQIGSMGAMAACMDLRLDESVGLLDHVPVLILLDRDVDAFLAAVEAPAVGAVFADCFVERVPAEAHDVPLDVVVTEREVWRVR